MAEKIRADLLASADCPAYLHEEKFTHALASWSEAEAMVSLIRGWLDTLPLDEALSEITSADEDESRPAPGGMRRTLRQRRRMPAVDALGKWMGKAQTLRRDLGLTPGAYADLARSVALTRKTQEDALERCAEKGREIIARREAEFRAGAAVAEESPA